MPEKSISIYLISDSSGETVASVSKAVLSQFEEVAKAHEYIWPLVRSESQVDEIIKTIAPSAGIIFFTIVDRSLKRYLEDRCHQLNIPSISLLEPATTVVASFLGIDVPMRAFPGKHKVLDEQYYRKIDIINYTVQHDDGQFFGDYSEADILILGVSRTSKSPTSLYLAQRGYKTANIPIIKGITLSLSEVNGPLIVGLMISSEVLAQIRANRILAFGGDNVLPHADNGYVKLSDIQSELIYAKKIFQLHNIPIIDVTKKAIEEIAAEIINMYYDKKGEHKMNF